MAYSALFSLEITIDQLLKHDRYSISPHEKQQIISLDKYVVSFQAFLEDFPEKAKDLEARIRDVAMKAEDIIEWFMLEQTRYYIYRHIKCIAELRRIKFKYQLHKVRDEMDSIAAEVVEIKNSIKIKDVQLGADSHGASSSSQVADIGKINMVGLNKDLIEIKAQLCGQVPQLQYLPIFGMGGIGKTTLARNAYDDQLIIEHFQIRVWVTISQDYSKRRVLLDLIDSMKEFDPRMSQRNESIAAEIYEESNSKMEEKVSMKEFDPRRSPRNGSIDAEIYEESNSKMEEKVSMKEFDPRRSQRNGAIAAEIYEESSSKMVERVYKILKGRRYLIVMDDMWNTKVLDDVMNLFPDDNNGSRIMLTTRLANVATYAKSSIPFYEMRLLDADQSWNLLQQKISTHRDHIPREWESSGREIARSCGGLPLAIVVVGGLISTLSKNLTSWEEISKNVKSSLATTDGKIEKILSSSYRHLPHHLRPCFLYMGGFPEDHEIRVRDLVRLWIAEGFVKPFVVSKTFEDRAEEYLEDLVNRSLIVVTKRSSNGRIKCCGLHDMVRELCIKISEEERFLVHVRGGKALKLLKSMTDQRRISISHSDLDSFANIFSSTIRTIMYFEYKLGSFGSFRLLRVLDVLRVTFKSRLITDQFFELFHLRYLAFCYKNYQIPRAISNLQSLQTLIIEGHYSNSRLPSEIWNMPQLRHLIFTHSCLDLPINGATSALENLQTLRKVENFSCSISILNMIPNLKELSLTYTVGGVPLLHNLVHLHRLEKLKLELQGSWYKSGSVHKLAAPSSLRKLTLIGWGHRGHHLNTIGPLPNLEVLKLRRFEFMQQEWIITDGDFPQLKFLLIDDSNLKQWETESGLMRLKVLLIHSCRSLIEVPEGIGEITTLELIEIKNCKRSLEDSAKLIQEEQQSYGNDDLEVRCVDSQSEPPIIVPEFSVSEIKDFLVKTTELTKPRARRRRRASGMHAVSYMLRHRVRASQL